MQAIRDAFYSGAVAEAVLALLMIAVVWYVWVSWYNR